MSAHSSSAAVATDHDHDHASHKKLYLTIGFALLVGTVVTVLARRIEFSSVALTISVALFIATIKGFLVAGYFMHLLSEKKLIYLVLATTVAFFIGMITLILWSDTDLPRGSLQKTHYVP